MVVVVRSTVSARGSNNWMHSNELNQIQIELIDVWYIFYLQILRYDSTLDSANKATSTSRWPHSHERHRHQNIGVRWFAVEKPVAAMFCVRENATINRGAVSTSTDVSQPINRQRLKITSRLYVIRRRSKRDYVIMYQGTYSSKTSSCTGLLSLSHHTRTVLYLTATFKQVTHLKDQTNKLH